MPTNYPVINIGLGTTGGEIVTLIAKMIRKEGDQWCKDYVESIVLLSESEPPQEVDVNLVRNFIRLCPGKVSTKTYVDDFAKATDPAVCKNFQLWYPLSGDNSPSYPPSSTFEEGCAGFRPAGRLLLHRMRAQNDSIRTQLSTLFQSIQKVADQQIRAQKISPQEIDCTKFVCNIFGTLAGGTASGLFLDFALLLRSAATQQGVNAMISGYFLTGDTCYVPTAPIHRSMTKVTMQRRNTIRALSEIALVQSSAGWETAAKQWPKRIGTDDLSADPSLAQGNVFPYDVLFLIGAAREGERKAALQETKDYFHLVANAVGQRLTTRIEIERKGSMVDVLNEHRQTWAKEVPKRANEIGSLGYLHIRIPKNKITAVVMKRLADKVLAEQMKNYNTALGQQVATEIRNQLGWDNLVHTWFSARNEAFAAATGSEPVAENGVAFSQAWLGAMKNMKNHYASWKDAPAEEYGGAQTAKETFGKAAETAIRHMLQRCLSAETFSFGTWKVLLENLLNDLSGTIQDTNTILASLNKTLLEDEGFEKRFEKVIAELATHYPRKGIMGLFDSRKSWHGHATAAGQYEAIRDALRLRTEIQVALEAFEEFKEELERLSVLRKLIGKRAGYPVITEAAKHENNVFKESADSSSSTQHEVVSSRTEVTRFVEMHLLRDGKILKEATNRFVRAFCQALRGPEAGTGDPLYTLNNLRSSLSSAPADVAVSHDNAWGDVVIQDSILTIRKTLQTAFAEQTKIIQDALKGFTIWDAIAASIASEGDEARKELLGLFGRFKAMGKVFWSPLAMQEGMDMEESRVVVFCDKTAANANLTRLGISDADFLEQLLRAAFDGRPEIQHKENFSELVSFVEKWGIRIQAAEFPEVKSILEVEADGGPVEYWSDRRFPEWIKQMRGS